MMRRAVSRTSPLPSYPLHGRTGTSRSSQTGSKMPSSPAFSVAWVAEEAAKLDAFERAVSPQALTGQVSAVHAVLGVMTRRAKLLGLDRPKRLTVTAVAEPEPSRTLGELFGVPDGDERALARLVCAQVKEFGNGQRVGQRG
jgi:hypothetical protein